VRGGYGHVVVPRAGLSGAAGKPLAAVTSGTRRSKALRQAARRRPKPPHAGVAGTT